MCSSDLRLSYIGFVSLFGNSPYYAINTTYIPLAIKISTGHCFPLAPLFLGHFYSQLDLQIFFWEHSVNYLFVAKDKVAAWSKFSDLPQGFLDCFPDF